MTGRGPVTLLAILGAAVAGIAAQVADAGVASLAWALLAGIGLSLMLRGAGLRVLGVLITVLSVAGAAWAVGDALWLPVVGLALTAAAGVGFVVFGPRWLGRDRDSSDAPADLWKAMDEGSDPTGEQDMYRSGEAR